MKKIGLCTTQIYPVAKEDIKDNYLIITKEQLINQLQSLKLDAHINIKDRLLEPIFYKDYNALAWAIEILEKLEFETERK